MDLALFEHCPGILVAVSPEGAIRGGNPEAERVLGRARVQGGSLLEAVHPDDRAAFAAAWARIGEGETWNGACQIHDAAGGPRAYAVSARRAPGQPDIHAVLVPAPSAPGAPASCPLASLPTNAPEHVLRMVLDYVDLVVFAIDLEGVYTLHDGKGARAAGFEPGQLVGKNFHDVYGIKAEDMPEMQRALAGEVVHMVTEAHETLWESWFVPARGPRGEVTGILGVTLDKSDMKRATRELEARLEVIERQQEVIRNLETPIIEVWDRVVTLPMVGIVDSRRAARVMDDLLAAVVRTQALFAILDLTGVDTVDTATASHLFGLIRAIRLLGAEGIITGIRPTVAQTMVQLGLDLTSLTTRANLRDGLNHCIRQMAPAKAKAKAKAKA
jgi:rsbT co-antagonist protein RsbR